MLILEKSVERQASLSLIHRFCDVADVRTRDFFARDLNARTASFSKKKKHNLGLLLHIQQV